MSSSLSPLRRAIRPFFSTSPRSLRRSVAPTLSPRHRRRCRATAPAPGHRLRRRGSSLRRFQVQPRRHAPCVRHARGQPHHQLRSAAVGRQRQFLGDHGTGAVELEGESLPAPQPGNQLVHLHVGLRAHDREGGLRQHPHRLRGHGPGLCARALQRPRGERPDVRPPGRARLSEAQVRAGRRRSCGGGGRRESQSGAAAGGRSRHRGAVGSAGRRERTERRVVVQWSRW
mmetsp:Transcript_9892/g.24474  ORF Transcript_9892/g.24474 Transcript_9892/m.24474 type:complete len:229 (-) Transcript_9892:325-1011(-)